MVTPTGEYFYQIGTHASEGLGIFILYTRNDNNMDDFKLSQTQLAIGNLKC